MSYKLHKLASGGLNAQGVPMGLVNYMCMNRNQKVSNRHDGVWVPEVRVRPPRFRHLDMQARGAPILWADLSLTRRDKPPIRGFLTINRFEWERH